MNPKQIIKYYFSRKPIQTKDNENIVIMSFNIRCVSKFDKGEKYYKVRLPYIREILEVENPDIIGFQEVRTRQFKYLLKILKNYDYEYTKRDCEKDSEAAPIFYKKNRFNCLKKSTFWLSDTYQIMSNTFNGKRFRTCSYIDLIDKKTNKELCVFNTHLDHVNETARIKGIKLIKRLINEFGFENIPHLIIGDMNNSYRSKTIDELLLNYQDASKLISNKNEFTYHNYGTEQKKIDYIALSKHITPIDYKVITTKFGNIYPSDHYPVEATIKV